MSASKAVNHMEQSNFEDAVCDAIGKRTGERPEPLESANYGVVAIERLEGREARKVDWQEVAAELARTTGVGVTCVVNCDWQRTDDCDVEATFIAFACPDVPESYREDRYRNLISAVDPSTAPSQQDFDNLRKAMRIVEERLRELDGRRGTLIAAGKSDTATTGEMVDVEGLRNLEASDREAVAAVLELDFARAIALAGGEPAAPTPGM